MTARTHVYPGTSLKASDLSSGRIFFTVWERAPAYIWDCGIAITRFLEGLRKGVIIGIRCHRCDLVMVPPRIWCMRCFKPVDDYVRLRDTGVVNTFSISYVRWDTKPLRKPQIPAVIEIDGASPGMGFLHLLGGVNPKRVHIGMRVRAVWKPPAQRTGAITDIRFFRPLGRR